jgi:molecular chaperone DnaK
MVKEAEENKEADEKRKGDIEIKNKAQTYVDEINANPHRKRRQDGSEAERRADEAPR